MPVPPLLVTTFIYLFALVLFFFANVGLIHIMMKYFLKITENKRSASFQVAFWVTLVAFTFSFFIQYPLMQLLSFVSLNAVFFLTMKYYFFLEWRKSVLVWLLWLSVYAIIGAGISLFS